MGNDGGTRGTIRVRLFARYAELVGQDDLVLPVTLPLTVRDLIRQIREQLPRGSELPEQLLAAVNLRHARPDTRLHDGDEVALLPPMAGG